MVDATGRSRNAGTVHTSSSAQTTCAPSCSGSVGLSGRAGAGGRSRCPPALGREAPHRPPRGTSTQECPSFSSYNPFDGPNENPEAELPLTAGKYLYVYGDMDEDGFYEGLWGGAGQWVCRACSTRPTSLPGALTDGPGPWLLLTLRPSDNGGVSWPQQTSDTPCSAPRQLLPTPQDEDSPVPEGTPASPVSLPQQPGLPQLTSSPAGRVVASLAQGDPTDL